MVKPSGPQPTIDELLDHAVAAINRGDRATADALAGRVLAVDRANPDAEELLAAPAEHGEIRRLTILFADLVDSTALATRTEPEIYRTVVGRYRNEVLRIVEHYEGHIGNTKGDGLLAIFGHPQAHENDVQRAVQAGLDIIGEVARLSERVRRRFGFDINARVGIHRGLVYLDTAQDDVYGFGANLAARLCSIAEPGTVAVSDAVERLVHDRFELEMRPPQPVRGVDGLIVSYRAVAERDTTRIPLGPLIGRKHEIAHLTASWTQAKAGTLSTAGVALYGEPGIGKSRLARAAVDIAERSDGVVLALVGSPFHTDVGLYPVRKLLARRCRIGRDASAAERLRLLEAEVRARSLNTGITVPLLAPVLGIAPEAGYEPVRAEGYKLQEQIAGAVHDYLFACLGDGPGLVLAEDMHWFDPSTVGVVHSLLGAGTGRLLVVMTSREMGALPDSSRADIFELKPLTTEEADQLIGALHPGLTSDVRVAVRRRCGGVPLYIEEVVAKLKEQPTDATESASVPDTLYEALLARLPSSKGALRVVEVAAAIGNQFDRGLLRSVVAVTNREVDRLIDELQGAQVLEPVGKDSLRFRHELLREVASELPPPSVRRRLHGQVADALKSTAAQGDSDWPLIALHFEAADRFDEAVSAHQRASAAARHRGALEEARTHLSRALGLLAHLPSGHERDQLEMALRLRHGFIASAAEGPGNADTAADFARCLQLGGDDPSADELFATMLALFTYYVNRAELDRAEHVQRVLRAGLEHGREWWLAENIGGQGTVCWLRGDFDTARAHMEESASLFAARGRRDVEAEWFVPYDPVVLIHTSLAQARWVLGDLAGADAALADSERIIDDLGFPQGPFSLCYVRFVQVWLGIEAGRMERAAELAADMTVIGERHGFDYMHAYGAVMQIAAAAAAALHTEPIDARAVSDHAASLTDWVEACRALEAKVFITAFDGLIVRLLLAASDLGQARDRADAGLQLAEETGMHYYDAELLRLRARTHDDAETRGRDLAAAVDLARHQGAIVFALRAAIDDFDLRGDPARAALADVASRIPADSAFPELARARARLGMVGQWALGTHR